MASPQPLQLPFDAVVRRLLGTGVGSATGGWVLGGDGDGAGGGACGLLPFGGSGGVCSGSGAKKGSVKFGRGFSQSIGDAGDEDW